MFKIDAHSHPDFLNKNIHSYIENMEETGISKACLLTWEAPISEIRHREIMYNPTFLSEEITIPFSRCLDYYEKAPDKFILGYAPDPRKPTALGKMRGAIETYGVKVCGEVKFRMMYDNPDAIDLFRLCGEYGVPVIMHFDYANACKSKCDDVLWPHYWFGGDIYTLDRVLELCPETNFLGHAPGFWGCLSNDDQWKEVNYPKGPVVRGGMIEKLLEKHENLYCDTSAGSAFVALTRDPDYTKELILKFPNRFIYARDMFSNELAPFIDGLGLPEDVLEGFYHKNFENIIPE